MSQPAQGRVLRRNLTSGRLLARNTIWNLISNGSPLLVAMVCIPRLISGLGKDRFGVLTLAWALIGYASLFDLGLGRALTQLVAQKLGEGKDDEIPAIVWTSLLLMLLLGMVGAAILFLIAPWIVIRVLQVSQALQQETVTSFRLLGISIPFVITAAGLRGLLEAHQKFRLVGALRIPMGIFTFAGPLLVLPFSARLVPVIVTLVIGRFIAWVAFFAMCLRTLPECRKSVICGSSVMRPLVRFGGWMTVTNIVSPLLVTLDRFLIGAMVSMTAVAYYATPYEVVTKFLLVPVALTGVMFPAFSTGYAHDRSRTARLYGRTVKVLFLILFPTMLCAIGLAQNGLKLWLGVEFAQHSYRVFQVLALGVFVNSLAQIPFALVQGAGRPDLTAKLHLIELPIYLGALWMFVRGYGIEGAAFAWTLRVTVDALLMYLVSRRFLPTTEVSATRKILLPISAMVVLAIAALLRDPTLKGLYLGATLVSFVLLMWFWVLTPEERTGMQKLSLFGTAGVQRVSS